MLLAGYIQVKSLHGPALAHPHPPVRSALHTSLDRAAAYHGKKRNTFLCDHSVLCPDDISRPGKARSCRTAENRSQERLVGTDVQNCPSWVDSLARQALLAFFARGAFGVYSKLIWPEQVFCGDARTVSYVLSLF